MWEFDYKESLALKNWCFWTVMLKTPDSPLDCKEVQSLHPNGNQSWIFIGRTDTEAEMPTLWPPDAKNQLIGKDPDTGKIEVGRGKGWPRIRWLDGITDSMDVSLSELRDWWWQGGLACCDSWGRKELDTTERLIWSYLIWMGYNDFITIIFLLWISITITAYALLSSLTCYLCDFMYRSYLHN